MIAEVESNRVGEERQTSSGAHDLFAIPSHGAPINVVNAITDSSVCLVTDIGGNISGVSIKKLRVPPVYVLDDTANAIRNPLILDCDYKVEQGESGLVVKWLQNGQPVYQWIPGSKPFPLSYFRGHVDTKYEASKAPEAKHRAIAITQPLYNMTGNYTCSVASFQSQDKRTSFLQIVVPDNDFQLSYNCCDEENAITVQCSTLKVFPEPTLTLSVDNMLVDTGEEKKRKKQNGLFESILTWKVNRAQLEPPVTFNCALSIPGTNYSVRRETIYYVGASTSSVDALLPTVSLLLGVLINHLLRECQLV
ncbi:uncharacterized protein LOC132255967 [Phlebotomus argentipes]|uniref:uncharacterized protein LOC132255967 n=1 Tax=Phlebotomus argentipes TaxID=94469 RepID=UPI002892D5FA|nr:uncharacterized protein LOC132255967 [Phlebotomus argentipes]